MITLQKDVLLQAIKSIKSSCGKVNLQPILSTIKIKSENGGLTLIATDLNDSAKTTIEANITSSIDICVNAEKLDNIVNKLDDIITFDIKDAFLVISSNDTKFELLWQNPEEFPEPNFEMSDNKISMSANTFISCVNKTCISTQNGSTTNLAGICLTLEDNFFEFASTDGNRLSRIVFNDSINKKGQYIISKKILLDVAKNIKDDIVEIYFNKVGIHEKIILKSNNCIYMSNLLSGVFPKYRQLIPQNQPKKVNINKNSLVNALEKVAIMVNNNTLITEFNFIAKNKQLELFTKSDCGTAKDKISIDCNFDENFKIAFNYRFILDGVKVMETENILFEMDEKLSPCLLTSNNYMYLIMPCQIRE